MTPRIQPVDCETALLFHPAAQDWLPEVLGCGVALGDGTKAVEVGRLGTVRAGVGGSHPLPSSCGFGPRIRVPLSPWPRGLTTWGASTAREDVGVRQQE
jgi:hypothetical protein